MTPSATQGDDVAVLEPTVPVPDDLPEYRGEPPASVLASAERAAWVPLPAAPRAAAAPVAEVAPDATPVGLRVRRWHLVAAGLVVAAALTGIAVIAAGYEPAGRADAMRTTDSVGVRPTWTPPALVRRPSVTLAPGFPTASTMPAQPRQPGQTALPSLPGLSKPQLLTPGILPTLPAPMVTPRLVPIPTKAVTPVPTDARSARFEAWGEPGAVIQVTVADSQHTRYLLPARRGPVAFDLPLPTPGTPSDFVLVQVQAPGSPGVNSRGDVACRVIVRGIVLRSQQGRGSAVCQLSPYYDVRRR